MGANSAAWDESGKWDRVKKQGNRHCCCIAIVPRGCKLINTQRPTKVHLCGRCHIFPLQGIERGLLPSNMNSDCLSTQRSHLNVRSSQRALGSLMLKDAIYRETISLYSQGSCSALCL